MNGSSNGWKVGVGRPAGSRLGESIPDGYDHGRVRSVGPERDPSCGMSLHREREGNDDIRTGTEMLSDDATVHGGGFTDSAEWAATGDSEVSEVSRDPEEFTSRLGLTDPCAVHRMRIRELFVVSGGRLSLARTVVEIAARSPLPVDLSAMSFADYVATLTPSPVLGLGDDDVRVAMVLSHLSSFTRQTALLAMSSVPPTAAEGIDLRGPEGILMRLQMAGVITLEECSGDRERQRIPVLLAAKLRFDMSGRHGTGQAIEGLVTVLADHLEKSQSTDPHLLSDVLSLSRRAGLWSVLIRMQESFGLQLFLIAPRAACAAFANLPAGAIAKPELRIVAVLTDAVVERLPAEFDLESVLEALVQATRPGRMRQYFPRTQIDGGEFGSVASGHRAGYFATIRSIVFLTREGRHDRAAALGFQWSAGAGAGRARLVVRFLAAVLLFHSAEPRRALSTLHEIEAAAADRHIGGDFLLPAVMAWTALIAIDSGDREAADEHLAYLEAGVHFPVILDEMAHPPMRVAAALRALDRLDLQRAQEEFDALTAYPENGSLGVYLPVIGRTIALLSAVSESGLLYVNDDVEKYRDTMEMSVAAGDLLSTSRSMVFVGLGQLKRAEVELERMSADSEARIVLAVRIELVAGRCQSAIDLVDIWFYRQSLTPMSRAELAAIKSAALLRLGQDTEAVSEFVTAVGLSAWVGSLLPLAFLPRHDRERLIDLSAHAHVWSELYSVFAAHYRNQNEFVACLRGIGAVLVSEATLPQLNGGEAVLLDLLAHGLSIAQISGELHQATGTVKNRLSVLYRKFEVSSRDEVLSRARSLGFLYHV